MIVYFYKGRTRQAVTLPNGEVVSLAPMRYYRFPDGAKLSSIEGLSSVSLSPGRMGEVVDLCGVQKGQTTVPKAPEVIEVGAKGVPFSAAIEEKVVKAAAVDDPKPLDLKGLNMAPRVPRKFRDKGSE
jgi:hypothetical protein